MTKTRYAFLVSQLHIDGFSTPFTLSRNRDEGGVIVYIREDIPCKLLSKYSSKEEFKELFKINVSIKENSRKC